jgi:hypothetical protein
MVLLQQKQIIRYSCPKKTNREGGIYAKRAGTNSLSTENRPYDQRIEKKDTFVMIREYLLLCTISQRRGYS